MTELIIERHEKWEPVEGIATAAARAVVSEDHEGLVVTMMFSEIGNDAPDADLRIRVGDDGILTSIVSEPHTFASLHKPSA